MNVKRILIGLMIALVLSGCGTATAPSSDTADGDVAVVAPTTEASPTLDTEDGGAAAETPTRQTVFANDLEPGDCWDPLGFSVTVEESEVVSGDTELVPCEQAHMAQVYAVFDLEGTEFPGDEQLAEECSWQCYERFEPFVGIAYESSALEVNMLWPCQTSWSQGDRTVICSVIDMYGEPLTGSMAGSMR